MLLGNKRGKNAFVLLFYFFFSLVFSALFIIAVMSKVNAAVNNSLFYKKFYSRDLALLVDALHASNANFSIDYDFYTRKSSIDVNLTKDRVIVSDSSELPLEQRAQTVFLFAHNPSVKVIPGGFNNKVFKLAVVREGDAITLKDFKHYSNGSGGSFSSGGGEGGG